MTVQLNHTIVWCKDKQASAEFLTSILGLPPAVPFAHFLVVHFQNGVSLDFFQVDEDIRLQHYAFLISEAEFDQVLDRIKARGLTYWADPGRTEPDRINHHDGGRGMYFMDPNGHLLETITRPYGTGAKKWAEERR